MIKQNLHTHSLYCDGKNTVDEMVLEAIRRGFTILGFSGHGYCSVDHCSMNEENTQKYIRDVLSAKEKYKDKITVFLGVEQDLLGQAAIKHQPYDYIIGSVHYMNLHQHYLAVDESYEMTQKIASAYGGFLNYAESYFNEVKKLADKDEIDIIGHIDLLTKFNEDESFIAFDNADYLQLAYACIDKLIDKGKIFEVNTGAIARGMRKTPYPHQTLLKYIYKHGGSICLNSDCHQKEMLDCYYKEALAFIQDCGFTSMMMLTQQGFVEKGIAEFIL